MDIEIISATTKTIAFVVENNWKTKGLPEHLAHLLECGWGNGYVAVHLGHPFWGKDYNDVPVAVHYGLTYGAPLENWIKHTKGGKFLTEHSTVDMEKVKNWYGFGFDTSHYDDNLMKWPKEAVIQETFNLQRQLEELNTPRMIDEDTRKLG